MPTLEQLKSCIDCDESKPLAEFYRNKSRKDGREAACKACSRARSSKYRQENPDHYREYRAANPEKSRESSRRWSEKNRDYHRQLRTAWREENPDYSHSYYLANRHAFWAAGYKSRAKALGVEPVVEDFTKDDVIAQYGDRCAYCETGAFEHLDHATPISAGGAHSLSNVRPSCADCNHAKHCQTAEEFTATGKK